MPCSSVKQECSFVNTSAIIPTTEKPGLLLYLYMVPFYPQFLNLFFVCVAEESRVPPPQEDACGGI